MDQSGRGQKQGLYMVGGTQGMGRIWKILKSPRVTVCLDGDLFLSLFLLQFFPLGIVFSYCLIPLQ